MLENIREGVQKPWAKIVVFVVAISFIFTGGFTASSFFSDPHAVATVNGESILRNDFQLAFENAKAMNPQGFERAQSQEGGEFAFKNDVLQKLVNQKLLEVSAKDLGLNISDVKLREVIQSAPNFQEDGKYSAEKLREITARVGWSDEKLKDFFRAQQVQNQLTSGLYATEFSLPNEVEKDYQLIAQKRSGRALKISYQPFEKAAQVSDEELSTYYDENKEEYRIEEKVSVEYIDLSVANLKALQSPSDEEIKTYYDQNAERYKLDSERQYSHILIKGTDDEALNKANSISERLKQGEDFAEIAKAESDDIPTRETGGDLGFMIPGALEPESEQAGQALENIGDVTEPVKLEIGYQLLKFTAEKEGKLQPLEEVKSEIITDLSQKMAEESYYAKLETLKEQTFQINDSLTEAAEAIGLKVEVSPLFSRASGKALFNNPSLREAAFSSEVLERGDNSSVIEVGENHSVVLRLKEHKPSFIEPFDKVADRVKKRVIQTKGKKAAYEFANQLLDKLESSDMKTVETMIQPYEFKWIPLDKVERNNASLSFLENQQFFKMPEPVNDEVQVELVEDFQSYTLLELNSVEPGHLAEADEAKKKQRELYISSFFSNSGYLSYAESLRNQADIKIKLSDKVAE
jgi:peptidyl-prolyl cis-trans isomerase D